MWRKKRIGGFNVVSPWTQSSKGVRPYPARVATSTLEVKVNLMFTLLIVAGMVGVAIWSFRRVTDPHERARLLRRTGMAIMGLVGAFFCLFVIGETMTDPGGWKGVELVALWFVPLVGMVVVAWLWPSVAIWLVGTLTTLTIALTGWRAVDEGIRDLEDRIGPFTTIALLAVAIAAAALGHRRTGAAGIMLVVLGAAPMLLWNILGPGDIRDVFLVAGSPIVVAGILYLVSDAIERRLPWPRAGGPERPRLGEAA